MSQAPIWLLELEVTSIVVPHAEPEPGTCQIIFVVDGWRRKEEFWEVGKSM